MLILEMQIVAPVQKAEIPCFLVLEKDRKGNWRRDESECACAYVCACVWEQFNNLDGNISFSTISALP